MSPQLEQSLRAWAAGVSDEYSESHQECSVKLEEALARIQALKLDNEKLRFAQERDKKIYREQLEAAVHAADAGQEGLETAQSDLRHMNRQVVELKNERVRSLQS
jgi:hypothetical protein